MSALVAGVTALAGLSHTNAKMGIWVGRRVAGERWRRRGRLTRLEVVDLVTVSRVVRHDGAEVHRKRDHH